ncbi:MAG TPA: type II toxin-antitoxin system VapC family toxin [Caulobacteraceae bacterium]|nr:type II toxin-antitoxin system VapC family toxin [Caulobacteraceae bacterium]
MIDTSAVAAILFGEPDARTFSEAIEAAPTRLISAVTRAELSFVVEGRKQEAARADLESLLDRAEFEVVAATPRHAEIAIEAFRRFGRGRHAAGLNICDCFAYALAIALDEPLLFKGDDFGQTDVKSALG